MQELSFPLPMMKLKLCNRNSYQHLSRLSMFCGILCLCMSLHRVCLSNNFGYILTSCEPLPNWQLHWSFSNCQYPAILTAWQQFGENSKIWQSTVNLL